MSDVLIRNLSNGPRDYPLNNGESIYLGSKGKSTGIIKISDTLISPAIRAAEDKGLLLITEVAG